MEPIDAETWSYTTGPLLKIVGISGETPFAEVDLEDPGRKSAARQVISSANLRRPHSRCPGCQSARRNKRYTVLRDGYRPCPDPWHESVRRLPAKPRT